MFTIYIIYIIFFFRYIYVLFVYDKAIKLITKYTKELIENNQYDLNIYYYSTMKIGFFKYLFSFWLWSVTKIFKPEYREIIKKYI